MSSGFSLLTVIIPTKNRPDDLDVTIAGVFDQTILPIQLIVVDQSVSDESQSRTVARYQALQPDVRKSLQLTYIRDTSLTGLTAARNRALRLVDADIVLFLDDDVIIERDFNAQILNVYRERPEAVGVSGIVTNYCPPPAPFRLWTRIFMCGPFWDDRQPLYWKAGRLRNSPPISVRKLGGGLMSFRMSSIIGSVFDESLTGACDGEDVEFCARMPTQAVLLLAPKARLVHKQSPTARSGEHWLSRHARTSWYLYRRNWNHGFGNRMYFLWLIVGYGIVSTAVSFRHFSLLPWRELLNSRRKARMLVGG